MQGHPCTPTTPAHPPPSTQSPSLTRDDSPARPLFSTLESPPTASDGSPPRALTAIKPDALRALVLPHAEVGARCMSVIARTLVFAQDTCASLLREHMHRHAAATGPAGVQLDALMTGVAWAAGAARHALVLAVQGALGEGEVATSAVAARCNKALEQRAAGLDC